MSAQAPLFGRTFDVAVWVLQQIPGEAELGRVLHRDVLTLQEHVVLALKGFDREDQVEQADACNLVLRVRLRLAHAVGWIDERQLLHVTAALDEVGRQIGGWIRHLEAATVPSRPR